MTKAPACSRGLVDGLQIVAKLAGGLRKPVAANSAIWGLWPSRYADLNACLRLRGEAETPLFGVFPYQSFSIGFLINRDHPLFGRQSLRFQGCQECPKLIQVYPNSDSTGARLN